MMTFSGLLLLYSPLNEAREVQLRRLLELHPRVVLITEGITQEQLPSWAVGRFFAVRPCTRVDITRSVAMLRAFAESVGLCFDGVISLSETGMYFCAHLAQEFDLCFPAPDTVVNARDKSRMRAIFERHHLPTVPFGTTGAVDEAREIAARIGYPIVIKPLLAGGSLFVRQIGSDSELVACFDEYKDGGVEVVAADPLVRATTERSGGRTLLIEKCIGGRTQFETSLPLPVGEVSIEGCVINGQAHVLAFHDKPLASNGPHYEEVLWSTPTRVPETWISRMKQLAQATVDAIEHNNGVFHLEVRTPDEGPVILEIAVRMGGGPIYRSIRESSAIDMIEVMLAIATRQANVAERLIPNKLCRPVLTFGLFADEGPLLAIEGLDAVRAHPNVLEVAIYEKPGTYIRRAPRSDHCTIHVMVSAPTHIEAEQVGKWVASTVRFVPDLDNQHHTDVL